MIRKGGNETRYDHEDNKKEMGNKKLFSNDQQFNDCHLWNSSILTGILVQSLSLAVCHVTVDDGNMVAVQLWSNVTVHLREVQFGRLGRSCGRTYYCVHLPSHRVSLWKKNCA